MENSLDNSEPALALEPAESLSARDSASEEAGAWWFHALLRCGEWDPKHFTHILDKCVPKFADTLAITAILSYACRDRSTAVPAGYVAIEGYLKIESARQARLGTLQRRLQHPDLAIDWTPIRMGRAGRYTGHECIQRFHRETALPPAGVLQTSAAAEGPRLRVDYRGDSDAPLNRGGWSGRTSARRGNGAGAAVDSPVTDGDPVTGRAAAGLNRWRQPPILKSYRSYFANTSVPRRRSTFASRIVSYPTSTKTAFGVWEELAMPATSWALLNNSKSCNALGFESRQQQAAWLARMCRFP